MLVGGGRLGSKQNSTRINPKRRDLVRRKRTVTYVTFVFGVSRRSNWARTISSTPTTALELMPVSHHTFVGVTNNGRICFDRSYVKVRRD